MSSLTLNKGEKITKKDSQKVECGLSASKTVCPNCGTPAREDFYYCELETCHRGGYKFDFVSLFPLCSKCIHLKVEEGTLKKLSQSIMIKKGERYIGWIETHRCEKCGQEYKFEKNN